MDCIATEQTLVRLDLVRCILESPAVVLRHFVTKAPVAVTNVRLVLIVVMQMIALTICVMLVSAVIPTMR